MLLFPLWGMRCYIYASGLCVGWSECVYGGCGFCWGWRAICLMVVCVYRECEETGVSMPTNIFSDPWYVVQRSRANPPVYWTWNAIDSGIANTYFKWISDQCTIHINLFSNLTTSISIIISQNWIVFDNLMIKTLNISGIPLLIKGGQCTEYIGCQYPLLVPTQVTFCSNA